MTCTRTYSGLCVYSPLIGPDDISNRLGIESTRGFQRDPGSRFKPNREHNFWLWSTQDVVESTDHMDHLSAIFSRLAGKELILSQLRSEGCTASISCYWDSDGQDGPWLTVDAVQQLARYGLDIWWDIYFDSGDDSPELESVDSST